MSIRAKIGVIVIFILLNFTLSGCSATRISVVKQKPAEDFSRVDRISVVVTDKDIYSLEEDHQHIVEDLKSLIIDELNDAGIKQGGNELTLKVVISAFNETHWVYIPPLPSKIGNSSITAEAYIIDANGKVLANYSIGAYSTMKMFEDNFREYAEDAYAKELVFFLKRDIFINKDQI